MSENKLINQFVEILFKRFPNGDLDVSSQIDDVAMELNLENNLIVFSMNFDSKVRNKLFNKYMTND